MSEKAEEDQGFWLDDEEANIEATNATVDNQDRVSQLEEELQRTKQELSDVRKDLAAKTVQLTRREQAAVHEKAQEIVAVANEEKNVQFQQVSAQLTSLEIALAMKEEELEESRRLYSAQKRALREALNAAAEREANDQAADEASRTAVEQAVEYEIDQLNHELLLTKARADLELKSRETEISTMKQQLSVATTHRKQAVAQAEAALNEAWQAEINRMQQEAEARALELESQIVRLMTQMEDARREDSSMSLTAELAALNKQKVQVQKEFEAFKDMALETSRSNRKEVAKLLEENANLHSRLATATVEHMNTMSQQTPNPVKGATKLFEMTGTTGYESYLPAVISRLEHQRKGLVPFIIVGTLFVLILVVAVTRAAVNARSQHQGPLCFLSNLGIRIGEGCSTMENSESKIVEMIEKPQRVHDVVDVTEQAVAIGEPHNIRRLLLKRLTVMSAEVLGTPGGESKDAD